MSTAAATGSDGAASAGAGLVADWWRIAGAGAALALVVAGRGDLTLLALGTAVAVSTTWGSATALVAAVALAVRWGTSDLAAIGGAVGVLGPAVRVGPAPAALSCALVGLALLSASLALPRHAVASRVALASTASLALVGPAAVADATRAAVAVVALLALTALVLVVGRRVDPVRAAGPASFLLALLAFLVAAPW